MSISLDNKTRSHATKGTEATRTTGKTGKASANEDTAASEEIYVHRAIIRTPHTTIISWVLIVLWAGFIFFMSANTGHNLSDGTGLVSYIFNMLHEAQTALLGPDIDMVSSAAHFCEYAVFGALWVNALRYHMPLRKAVVLAVMCASLYGVTDELHQLFVEGRMCDPVDWIVDTVGATIGASITRAVVDRRSARLHR